MTPPLDILPPNEPDGHHRRRGERIERKLVEIGRGKYQDFITKCTLSECDVRIHCGARFVNLIDSTFERCTFRPRREMKNLRFPGTTLRACEFLGKYTGCRFGNVEADQRSEIRNCDFSRSTLLHICDFLDGADVASLRWPSWPHIVVTGLPRSAPDWLKLQLPEELASIQKVIGTAAS